MIHTEILTRFGLLDFQKLKIVMSMGEAVDKWLTNDLMVKDPPDPRDQILLFREFIMIPSNELNKACESGTSSSFNNLLKYRDQELVWLSHWSAIDPFRLRTKQNRLGYLLFTFVTCSKTKTKVIIFLCFLTTILFYELLAHMYSMKGISMHYPIQDCFNGWR